MAASLPSAPFFTTPQQRVALARERFFEEGVRPSGLVSETVIQSWARCVGARRQPGERIAFDPVTKTRVATAMGHNRLLLEAAREDLGQLDHALAGTACKAILTNHDGVVIHATPTARGEGRLMPLVTRVGVDLGEGCVGTSAPGVVARTGECCTVQGAEHFFAGIKVMYCAAAPIRNVRGDVAAVLDISSESEMFRFDAAAMVHLYATAIENRLLERQSRDGEVLLRFQAGPNLLHTPLEGLAGIDAQGRVAWLNATGASLLGCSRLPGLELSAEALFGLQVQALLAIGGAGRVVPHRVPGGLSLWMSAALPLRDGGQGVMVAVPRDAPATERIAPVRPAPSVAAATLGAASRELIERTMAECKGNVSRAARRLGVSRGLLYRRLREWAAQVQPAAAAQCAGSASSTPNSLPVSPAS